MSNGETYNGWANRETWAFNLHWQNDQGLYNETLEQAGGFVQRKSIASHAAEAPSDRDLGEYVVDYWEHVADEYEDEYGTRMPEVLRMFFREVGSFWRVDRAEVGAAVRESLDAEGE